MTRAERALIGILVIGALIAGINAIPAVGRWNATWQAYDKFGISLTRIDYTDSSASTGPLLRVSFQLVNLSGSTVQVSNLQNQVMLNNHPLAAGGSPESIVSLAPGQRRVVVVDDGFQSPGDSDLVRQSAGRRVWYVSGSLQLTTHGQNSSAMMPYSGTMVDDGQ